MSAIHEQPIVIQGRLPSPMLGVLTSPGKGLHSSVTGMVIVNGGAQYRVGAHRLFVQLARHLASKGHAVLRFDLPGQGDSPGEPVGFEVTAPHIGAAIDALHQHQPQLIHTALLGLCDGASASLLYLHARPDPRVTHLVLLNPWVRSELSLAKAQIRHYYLRRLLMPEFWKKLVQGRVGSSALRELLQKVRLTKQHTRKTSERTFQDIMASTWHAFGGSVLLLLSDRDLAAQEFRSYAGHDERWRNWQQRGELKITELDNADHTYSTPSAQLALTEHVGEWLRNPPRETPQ